jgi:hypothetical protein
LGLRSTGFGEAEVRLCFEFLTVFRQKFGRDSLAIRLPARPGKPPSVLEALQALEDTLGIGGSRLLEGGRAAGGLLVFRRTPEGALQRIRNPGDQIVAAGDTLVLSAAMEGG